MLLSCIVLVYTGRQLRPGPGCLLVSCQKYCTGWWPVCCAVSTFVPQPLRGMETLLCLPERPLCNPTTIRGKGRSKLWGLSYEGARAPRPHTLCGLVNILLGCILFNEAQPCSISSMSGVVCFGCTSICGAMQEWCVTTAYCELPRSGVGAVT